MALRASSLKAKRRLLLAGAIIAAYAACNAATLMHRDPELEVLSPEIRTKLLPYKVASGWFGWPVLVLR